VVATPTFCSPSSPCRAVGPQTASVGSEVAHRVAQMLATVRRSNRACGFPAHGFHEGSLFREAVEERNGPSLPPLGRSVQQFPRAKRTGISLKELIHLSTLTHCLPLSSQPPSSVAFPNPFGRRLPGHAAFTALKVLLNRPTTDKASLTLSLSLIGLLTPKPSRDLVSSPEVTHCSSVPCRPQTPWCGG
jgi:hypothetical protein